MVDTEARPVFTNRLEETGIKSSHVTVGGINTRVTRSGPHIEGRVSRINQSIGINSPRAVNISSPRPRDNVISVIHGSQDEIDQISRRSSQTPVEFIQRNERRQIDDVGRSTIQVVSTQTPIDHTGNTNNETDIVERIHNTETRQSTDAFIVPQLTDTRLDRRSTTNNEHRVIVTAVENNEQNVNHFTESSHHIANDRTISPHVPRNTDQNQPRYNETFNPNAVRERQNEREYIRESQTDRYTSGATDRDDLSDATNRYSGRYSDRHYNRRSFRDYGSDANTERVRSHHHSVASRSVSSGRTRASSGRASSGRQRIRSARTMSTYTEEDEKDERYVVPALPLPLAIVCCVLNFAIPGFGTMIASVGVLCCAKTEDMNFKEKCGSCCMVFGIGILQLLLVACFLIGWIWSCIWGITFIGMSKNYYQEEELHPNLPAWERNMIGRTPLPEPQIVENQPYPGIGYDDLRRAYEGRRRRRQERQQQQQQQQRRSRSRLSDFIYPMRAPSNMAYHSPPPTIYPMRAPSNMAYHSPPPSYEDATGQLNNRSLDALAANLEDARRHDGTQRDERTDMTEEQLIESFRPMNSVIHEEA